MAKRIADKELTDRNWDQEEEGEEAGTFSVASDDVLKHRAIKKAKRRNVGSETEVSGTFKGFKSFTLTSVSGGSAPPAFTGFGSDFKGLSSLTNGSTTTNSTPSFGGFSSSGAKPLTFNGPSSSAKPTANIGTQQTNGSAPTASGNSNKEYSRQLTALNCSVRDWITKHVNDNPLCDLNPIFKDYERHLASIEQQYGAGSADTSSDEKRPPDAVPSTDPPPSSSDSSAPPARPTPFSFGTFTKKDSPPDKSGGAPKPAGVSFNFGQKVDAAVLGSLGSKSAPSFSFSSSQSSVFGTPSMTFGATKSEEAPSADQNADEDEEEQPKPEVKEVKEDDAFFSKKCKLFYKKEAEFKEKGVGTLHLKQTADGKTQMVIRADTNLGNILLNILLQASLPCTRVGKNNVMVVCVPNPPVDDKNPASPVPLLIRVKTAEDAEELHKLLEEKKG